MKGKITPERIDAVLSEARSLLRHEHENRNRRALVEIVEHLRQRYHRDARIADIIAKDSSTHAMQSASIARIA